MSRENSRRDLTNERTENRPRSRELTLEGSLIFRSCPSRQRLLQPLSRTRTTDTNARRRIGRARERERERGSERERERERSPLRWPEGMRAGNGAATRRSRLPQVRRKDVARIRVVTIRNVKVTRFGKKKNSTGGGGSLACPPPSSRIIRIV